MSEDQGSMPTTEGSTSALDSSKTSPTRIRDPDKESAAESFWLTCPFPDSYVAEEVVTLSSSSLDTNAASTVLHKQEAPFYLELGRCKRCRDTESRDANNRRNTDSEKIQTSVMHFAPRTRLSIELPSHNVENESTRRTSEGEMETQACGSTSSEMPSVKMCKTNKTCDVCGDKAIGFHYKAVACEGCKGFFRRSVDKGKWYKCHCSQRCKIDRVTRNRCQACRFNKCLQVGMCIEAVRRDCERKRKQTSVKSFDSFLPEMDDAAAAIIEEVLEAHRTTYTTTDIRSEKLSNSPLQSGDNQNFVMDDDNDLSLAGIFRVIHYSKKVPGFSSLCKQDQVILLKHACIEIMVLRFCTRYFPEVDSFHFPNGSSISREVTEKHFGSLAALTIDMANSLIRLNTDDTELALMQATCLLSSVRPGLKYRQQVQHLEEQISMALTIYVCQRRITRPTALQEMVHKLYSLRSMGRMGSQITLISQQISESSNLHLV